MSDGRYVRKNVEQLLPRDKNRLRIALEQFKASEEEWTNVVAIHGGGHRPEIADFIRSAADYNWEQLGRRGAGNVQRPPRTQSQVLNYIFCAHKVDWFWIWHRPYMYLFEWYLQKYDPEEKGHNDPDSLGLPYWNWDNGYSTIPEFFSEPRVTVRRPNGVEEEIDNPWLNGPTRPGQPTALTRRNRSLRFTSSYETLLNSVLNNNSYTEANTDLELGPHGAVHVNVGGFFGRWRGDMGWPPSASWDPIFWAHHCNVERHNTNWLANHTPSDPIWSRTPLIPFSNPPVMGNIVLPWEVQNNAFTVASDWFNNDIMPYRYDQPPPVIPPSSFALRASDTPTSRYLRLWIKNEPSHVSILHLWLAPKGTDYIPEIDDYYYAGSISLFIVGDQLHCDNCATRNGLRLILDVTQHVQKLGVALSELDLKHELEIYRSKTEEELAAGSQDDNVRADETVEINEWFVGPRHSLEPGRLGVDDDLLNNIHSRHVLAKFLEEAGGDINTYNELKEALTVLQKHFKEKGIFKNLTDDGVFGVETGKLFTEKRCPSPKALSAVVNSLSRENSTVSLTISTAHCPLPASSLHNAVNTVMAKWQSWTGVAFTAEYANAPSKPGVFVSWKYIDGVGSILGWATEDTGDEKKLANIYLDRWEKWDEDLFERVLAHELGHTLGFMHSDDPDDIMFGYARQPPSLKGQEEHVQEIRNKIA